MSLSRGAIILCGGASTRMGCDKALLPFGPEEVLLQRVVRLVGEAVPIEQIVCVAAADQTIPSLPGAVEVVRDTESHLGPLAGLASGLAALSARADVAFVCGCDAPLLSKAFIQRMFGLLDSHQIAVPYDGTNLHPLAAVYRTSIWSTAESLLESGKRSLVSLVDECDSLRATVDGLRDVDPQLASLENCNTPAELQRAIVTAFARSTEP
jgi:molybdenum cofactor guanylyltransferase